MLIILMTGLLGVVLGFRFRPERARLLAGLAVLLISVDLFQAQTTRYFVLEDPQSGYQHPETVNFLEQQIGYFRIDNTYAAGQDDWEWLAGLLHGIPMATGLPWNPFKLVNHADYLTAVNQREGPFYDFLAVKYLITAEGESLPTPWLQQPDGSSRVDMYENTMVLPRAFMVYQAIVEPDDAQSLALIGEKAFDPAETVLLASGNPLAGLPGTGDVQIISAGTNEISLTVDTTQPGYLVLSDTYYPGWQVWIDGRETEILRANHAFRAVFLPTGFHEIQFKFRPVSVYIGLSVTLGTILVLGGWAAFRQLKRKSYLESSYENPSG
jgi:hypothetical protein